MAISSVVMSHEEKRIHEFYQIVYLLQSLGIRRGDRIKGELSPERKDYSIVKHRRNIADSLAYMAAYDKTPDRVTAVALGKEKGKLVVWIAANKGVKNEVKGFLDTVLSWLEKTAHSPKSEEGYFLDFVLRFNEKGVHKYYRKFCQFWEPYRESHKDSSHDVLRELDIWVRGTFYKAGERLQPEDMVNLAKKCHQARNQDDTVFSMLSEALGQGIMPLHEYERLHVLLYKIGKNVTLCRKLIDARRSLSDDFKQGAVVKPVHVPSRQLNGIKRNYSLDSIATHIFQSEISLLVIYAIRILPNIPDHGFGPLRIRNFTIVGVYQKCEGTRTVKSSWLLQRKSFNGNYETISQSSKGREHYMTIQLQGPLLLISVNGRDRNTVTSMPPRSTIDVGVEETEKLDDDTDGGVSLL
ncbi:hypothetical protein BDV36DRAFT_309791 [Aspergillus pseudocaelatus]|uniref:Uncharacterized protein n=1 Tax=Aspergillus pseudocaelatus TaxID=1825620 RepID=A0ABQ6X0E7_9EURO|nr:hypothetical protein BDV36DRAFT_309791 [Aspergillus pseudocaelatus]